MVSCCHEGAPSQESAMETTKERGAGPVSVINVLLDSGVGCINFWVGYLGFVGGDVPESGGSAFGLPQTDDGQKEKQQRDGTWRR